MMAMIPAVMSRTNLGLNIKEHRTTSTEAAQVPLLMKVTSVLALSVIRTLKKLCLCNLGIKEILYCARRYLPNVFPLTSTPP